MEIERRMRIFRNKCKKCGHEGKYSAEMMDTHVMCSQCGNITDLGNSGVLIEWE